MYVFTDSPKHNSHIKVWVSGDTYLTNTLSKTYKIICSMNINNDKNILKCLVADIKCMNEILLHQNTSEPKQYIDQDCQVALYIMTGAWEMELQ